MSGRGKNMQDRKSLRSQSSGSLVYTYRSTRFILER